MANRLEVEGEGGGWAELSFSLIWVWETPTSTDWLLKEIGDRGGAGEEVWAAVPDSPRGLEEEVGGPLGEEAGSLLWREAPLPRDGRLGGEEAGGLAKGDASGELPWELLAAQEGAPVLE